MRDVTKREKALPATVGRITGKPRPETSACCSKSVCPVLQPEASHKKPQCSSRQPLERQCRERLPEQKNAQSPECKV